MKNKTNMLLGIVVVLLVGWMLKGTFSQPGIDGLKGNFKEVTYYRNENNTGPVQYVFIVTVNDTASSELEAYGNFQPHHKGGNTKVYFFLEGSPVPQQAYAGQVNFDPSYNKYCFAQYEKSAMGNTSLIREPLK